MLEEKGHPVIHETARTFIDQEMSKGLTIEEIRKDEQAFQRKILEMKIEIEKIQPKEPLTFFDRGIPDTWAYDKLYEVENNLILENAMKECWYKKIFILDQLPYIVDYARTESKEQQDKLHEYLEEVYRMLNFEVVRVPVLPPEERLKFILGNL